MWHKREGMALWRGSTPGAAWRRQRWMILLLLIPGLLLAGCGPDSADPGQQRSPLPTASEEGNSRVSVLSTPTEPLDRMTPLPSAADPLRQQLAILHTNDNWGETEPCG